MRIVRFLVPSLLAMTALSSLAGSAAAQTVGYPERIEIYAYGTKPGEMRTPLFERQALVADQVVETVERGSASLRLADDTSFVLGPASTLTLDRYVYDPQSSNGEAAIKLGVGAFRYISGRMSKDRVAIKVPSATIGVRGTVIGMQIGEDQASIIQVTEGAAVLSPDSGAPPVTVSAGQTAMISPTGAVTVVQTSGSVPPIGPSAQPGPVSSDAAGDAGESSSSSSSSH